METKVPRKKRTRGPNKKHEMSQEELLALPVSFGLDTAARALGIAPSTAQALAKSGDFPCKVLRIGRMYKVTRADLFRMLGIEDDVAARPDTELAKAG